MIQIVVGDQVDDEWVDLSANNAFHAIVVGSQHVNAAPGADKQGALKWVATHPIG